MRICFQRLSYMHACYYHFEWSQIACNLSKVLDACHLQIPLAISLICSTSLFEAQAHPFLHLFCGVTHVIIVACHIIPCFAAGMLPCFYTTIPTCYNI